MTRLLPVLALLLASCGHAPAPEECKALADPKAVIERCYGGKLDGSAKYIGDLKCWPFSEVKRLRGIWVIDLEASQFFPNVGTLKEANGEPKWLESNLLHSRGQILDAAQGARRRVYAVDFEGRDSLCDSDFGHMGMPPRMVIANRFYSMRLLPSRPS